MSDAQELWKSCSELLRVQVSEATWMAWFHELNPITIMGDTLVLAAPSSLVRERITGRYLAMVEDVVAEMAQSRLSVEVLVEAPVNGPVTETPPAPVAGEPRFEPAAARPNGSRSAATRPPPADEGRREQPLNPRYTFDAFVIGASNRFAHAAAQRVAETPASSYNPLFIYGDSGLGKTHLLHAIGHYVRRELPAPPRPLRRRPRRS